MLLNGGLNKNQDTGFTSHVIHRGKEYQYDANGKGVLIKDLSFIRSLLLPVCRLF